MTVKEYADKIQAELGEHWLPQIYRERILKLRTRVYNFGNLQRAPRVEIQHTLLGVELKVGRRRLLCPDLATARYLSILARVSVTEVALPYDITRISHFADQLESSWYKMLLLVDHHAANESEQFRNRTRRELIARVHKEISAAEAPAKSVGASLGGKTRFT